MFNIIKGLFIKFINYLFPSSQQSNSPANSFESYKSLSVKPTKQPTPELDRFKTCYERRFDLNDLASNKQTTTLNEYLKKPYKSPLYDKQFCSSFSAVYDRNTQTYGEIIKIDAKEQVFGNKITSRHKNAFKEVANAIAVFGKQGKNKGLSQDVANIIYGYIGQGYVTNEAIKKLVEGAKKRIHGKSSAGLSPQEVLRKQLPETRFTYYTR
jgi:hypothetical protein